MSERQEKKRRYKRRLEYIERLALWLEWEPPIWCIWKWHRWKEARPVERRR